MSEKKMDIEFEESSGNVFADLGLEDADSAAVKRVKDHLPRLAQASEEEILAAKFTLQNAQHVIARECGFHT